jgi:hypothetical protein
VLVYPYRANAATTDLPIVATVTHRGRDVPIVNAPDGVWQLLLTDGWLVYPNELDSNPITAIRAILELQEAPDLPEPEEHLVILDEAHAYTQEEPGTPLPHDFPHRLTWIRAGIETGEAFLSLTRDQATALKGITDRRFEDAMLYVMRPDDDEE